MVIFGVFLPTLQQHLLFQKEAEPVLPPDCLQVQAIVTFNANHFSFLLNSCPDPLQHFPAIPFCESVIPPGTKEDYTDLITSCLHAIFDRVDQE